MPLAELPLVALSTIPKHGGEPENRTLSRPFERVIVFETSTDHSVLLSENGGR